MTRRLGKAELHLLTFSRVYGLNVKDMYFTRNITHLIVDTILYCHIVFLKYNREIFKYPYLLFSLKMNHMKCYMYVKMKTKDRYESENFKVDLRKSQKLKCLSFPFCLFLV